MEHILQTHCFLIDLPTITIIYAFAIAQSFLAVWGMRHPGTRRTTTFRSTTDHIRSRGPIRYNKTAKFPLLSDVAGPVMLYGNASLTRLW